MTSLGPGFHGGLAGHISVNASTSTDLVLKSSCSECGTSIDLYGSNCKHITFCFSCGTQRVKSQTPCTDCGMPVKLLIREYNVRAATVTEKNHFIGKFSQTLPNFSKKKSSDAKWTLHKEGLKGKQMTEALRDKYKNKPWALEEETSQQQFQGQLEGSQNASYYLLMLHGKEFTAIPAGSWYTFNKVAQYKQLSLEEAEEKMRTRKKNAEGYQRWLMKTAKDGAAAFGEVEKMEASSTGTGGGRRKKSDDDGDDAALSDRGEEDGEEEEARKNRLGFNNKKGEEDEDGPTANDHDVEEDDIEKGDDWEHEEVFTDDDEAVGNDPEEREDIGPEVPAPPEIKQDEEDGEGNEEEGEGLSKSGKELKKLLGKRSANESEEEDDEYEDVDDEIGLSPVLAPKHKDVPKEEPVETTPIKEKISSTNSTPNATKSVKGKRKAGSEDVKPNVTTPAKKIKTEDSKQTALVAVKEEIAPTGKNSQSTKPVAQTSNKTAGVQSTGPVTEEELKTVLKQVAPITTQELVAKFKARLKSSEDKASFAAILKKISRIQKTNGGTFVVLREK